MNLLFKALNDQTRREILELLKKNELTAGEIADHFNISKPSISHHLDILKQAGLVVAEKQGQYIYYSLSTTVIDEILKWLLQFKKKMNKQLLKHTAFILVSLLPLFYLFIDWENIPAQVAIHFNSKMEPDNYISKSNLWIECVVMSCITILVYLLLQFINKIDPKLANKPKFPIFNKLAVTFVIFLTAINLSMLIASAYPQQKILDVLMNPLLGLLFVFLGNYMYSVSPNYFVGIKIPWTLASDHNWRKTHQLTGILWFVCGLLITITSFVFNVVTEDMILKILLGVMIIIPAAYSFFLFKKESKKKGYFDKEFNKG